MAQRGLDLPRERCVGASLPRSLAVFESPKLTGFMAVGIWLAPSVFNPLSPPAPTSTSTTLTVDPHIDEFSLRYSHPSPPFLTLIGSSNFGSRSASRDLEAGVLVTTQNSNLRWALENEVRSIRKYADVLVDRALFAKPDRRVPWGVRVAANAIETML